MVTFTLLVVLAVVMLFPFLWMVSTSLKTPKALLAIPPSLLPSPIATSNYQEVTDFMPIGKFLYNSFKISVIGTIGQLIAAALAAYAFARFDFAGKKLLYAALLATMMIPFQVTMVPVYMVMNWLGLLDTHAALIAPHFFGGAFASAAFGIFLLRQFFETIPRELDDAARIDGAGHFRIFYQILLPLSRPSLIVLALFIFMGIYNDLLGPVLFLSSEELMPLPFGLATLQTAAQHMSRYDLLMAGTLISVIPILLLYVLAQRRVTEAFLEGGLKG